MAKFVYRSDRAEDDAVAERVERGLRRLGFHSVDCEVDSRIARLVGRVPRASDARLAVAAALTTPGVAETRDELAVQLGPRRG